MLSSISFQGSIPSLFLRFESRQAEIFFWEMRLQKSGCVASEMRFSPSHPLLERPFILLMAPSPPLPSLQLALRPFPSPFLPRTYFPPRILQYSSDICERERESEDDSGVVRMPRDIARTTSCHPSIEFWVFIAYLAALHSQPFSTSNPGQLSELFYIYRSKLFWFILFLNPRKTVSLSVAF